MKISKDADYATWGRLSTKAAREAATKLSDAAFKLWVQMAMNQSGFVYQLDRHQEDKAVGELVACGYLSVLGDGRMTFSEQGGLEEMPLSEAWQGLMAKYEDVGSEAAEYEYIRQRLAASCLEDQIDSILWFWLCCFEELAEQRKRKSAAVSKPVRFDFAVLMKWYLWENFFFEAGDTLPLDGVRCADAVVQAKVAAWQQRHSAVTMRPDNVEKWNQILAAHKIEVSLAAVGAILRQRKLQDKVAV